MIRTQLRARREAERRYPAHVRIAVPPEGLGRQLDIMHAWLNETCGAEGWAKAPAGTTGVVNDPMALYFEDAAVAQAFVARFCCGYRIETIAGAFAIRDDAVKTRRVAAVHKAPSERSRPGKWICSIGPGWRRRPRAPRCSTP